MKKHKKGRIKRMYTSLRYRMVSISVSVIIFIAVMIAAMLVELYNNQEQYISMYQKEQQRYLELLADDFSYRLANGQKQEEIVSYLANDVEASGSRFFVLTCKDTVLFAKNDITTKCLGSLKDKTEFYTSIQKQDVMVEKTSFTGGGNAYELAVVSDVYSVKMEGDLNKHRYYMLLAVAIMGLVLVSLLVTLLGYWNRTEKKLNGAEKELDIRNEKIEKISQETGMLTGDKTDLLTKEEVTGIIKSEKAEFYNIYTIKMLLQKSEDAELKPLQIILVKVVMGNRYYTKDQIFNAMGRIQQGLRPVEVMGEVKRGHFVILAYRTPVAVAKTRIREITEICRVIEKEEGFAIQCRLLEDDDKTAIDRFEACLKEDEV